MKRAKRILAVCLTLGMLITSTIFMVSAASHTSEQSFNVTSGGNYGYFKGTLISNTNASNNVSSVTFSIGNGTGISTTKTQTFSGAYAYGKLVSCQLYGSYVTVTNSPAVIMRHYWSGQSCSVTKYAGGPNINPA